MEELSVWKVELEKGLAAHDVRGTLRVTDRDLVFTPHGETVEVPIALTAITKVVRIRLSGVLVMRWIDDGVSRETAYYTTKPPPLQQPPDETRAAPLPPGRTSRFGKRMQQRRNGTYLAHAGQLSRPALKAWIAELEAARRAAAG